jgi:beta-lactamase regulating signal transducer with metallopeptidase domain
MIAAYQNLAASIPYLGLLSGEGLAQTAIERAVRSLPEGLLIAAFAWAVLRVLPRQNSRTRFAVWFVALVAVVGLCGVELPHSKIAQNAFLEWGTLGFSSPRISEIHLPAHWASYLFVVWSVVAMIGIARLIAGLGHLRALRSSCSFVNSDQLDPSVAATMDELNSAGGFGSRRVTLATSERVRVPAALGLWSPMIVLPGWALAELPTEELSIILRHEFAHLRRWDDWTNLIQKVVRAVFFFHPAVWWIESRLSVEREMACDDIVVAETDNPMGYANCLVSLLERSLAQRGWTMAQAIVHRAREASERVAQILDKNRPAARGISKPALGLVGTFAAVCLVMLPATPQFVAFDRATVSAPAEHQYSAGLVRPASLRTADYRSGDDQGLLHAAVIPASLKSDDSAARRVNVRTKTGIREASRGISNHNFQVSNAPGISQPRNSDDPSSASSVDSMAQLNAPSEVVVADHESQSGMQRLLLVSEAQFVTAEFPVTEFAVVNLPRGPVVVWSVQMMRVTLVAPVWREMRLPAAKKI